MMMKQSINITENGLWFVQIGLDTRWSHLGLAPFSPHVIGGSADASFEFAPSTHVQLEFAQAHFAQEFRFGAQAPSTPALNSSQSCFGANFPIDQSPLSVRLILCIIIVGVRR